VILADTSVWVDFFRGGDARFARCLQRGEIALHPFVLGELALGHIKDRSATLADLHALPAAALASDGEVRFLIESAPLYGRGIGYVDAALLASVRLQTELRLWTRDKRLGAAAEQTGIALVEP
jgi:hypothetical protein